MSGRALGKQLSPLPAAVQKHSRAMSSFPQTAISFLNWSIHPTATDTDTQRSQITRRLEILTAPCAGRKPSVYTHKVKEMPYNYSAPHSDVLVVMMLYQSAPSFSWQVLFSLRFTMYW